ncbi:GAP1-N2 domain-containing protein [Dictyobacter formicarum]|uniref:GTPase-associated protein 1 N-terminal domain-containing protein n=1 Tax=Dictyobacter formicarum TaxID=2778368 RepID=A0ABQ3VKX6_9CHLR|nr:hypothetical protein [Dictyobacter formicarum]GHO86344.1 hypothetical protein KSZ_43500 [Dictyobacter formicarum]
MDQLWYTWSTFGLGSVTGHRVRAASHELMDLQGDWHREIERHLHYELPEGVNPYDINTTSSPYSLAYIKTEKGPIILHRAYAGKDDYGRAGVFFVHVLANLKDMLALDAIKLWGSPFWKMQDDLPSAQLELPEVADVPVGSLNVSTVPNQPTSQQLYTQNLTFLIESYLSLGDWQNIYIETYAEEGIHAASEHNAELIWGLLHCLPPYLTDVATFSTYEARIEQSPARISSTCFASLDALQRSRPHDGPTLKCAYGRDGGSLFLEATVPPQADVDEATTASTSQSSTEQQQLRHNYARYVVAKLLGGSEKDLKELEALFNLSVDWHIKDSATFLLAYKLFTSDKLTEEDMRIVLMPERATALLMPETVRDAVLQFIFAHPQWWSEGGQEAWQQLYQRTADTPGLARTLNDFATYIKDKTIVDLIGGNPGRANMYLSLLSTIAPPKHQQRLWRSLLEGLTPRLDENRQQYPYELLDPTFYACLLENCSYISDLPDDILHPWLRVPWDKIRILCQQNITPAWKARAIAWLILLDPNPLPENIVAIVTSVQEDYEAALKYIVCFEEANPAISNLIMMIKDFGYQYGASAVSQLLFTHLLDASDIERLLKETRLKWSEGDALFLQHWEFLLLAAPDVPIVIKCVERFFNKLSDASLLTQPGTVSLLKMVSERMTHSPSLMEAVEDWTSIKQTVHISPNTGASWLVRSEKELDHLVSTIQKLSLQKDSYYRTRLFRYLITAIKSNEDLERCKRYFHHTFFTPQNGRMAFIRELDLLVGEIHQPQMKPDLLLPYIYQTILDAWDYPRKKKEEVLPELLGSLLQNADKKTFDFIDHNNKWPGDIEKEWKHYSADLRPNSLLGFIPIPWRSSKKSETAKLPAISPNPTTQVSHSHAPVPAQGLQLSQRRLPVMHQSTPNVAKPLTSQFVAQPSSKSRSLPTAHNLMQKEQAQPNVATPQTNHPSSGDLPMLDNNIVAQLGKYQVTLEEAKAFKELRLLYMIFRDRLDKINAGDDYKVLTANELIRFDQNTIREAIYALVHDGYINEALCRLESFSKQQIDERANEIIEKLQREKEYIKLVRKGKYSNEDLKDVIGVLLRARMWESELLKQKKDLRTWISTNFSKDIWYNNELINWEKKGLNI